MKKKGILYPPKKEKKVLTYGPTFLSFVISFPKGKYYSVRKQNL